MWKNFKEFAFKGNVIDLAVGVIIGAAFGKIVSGFVADIIMPVVGFMLPAGDWRTAAIVLREGPDPAVATDDLRISYGDFLGIMVDFVIVAFVLFLLITAIKKATTKPEEPKNEAATARECPFCMESISVKAKKCRACTADVVPTAA